MTSPSPVSRSEDCLCIQANTLLFPSNFHGSSIPCESSSLTLPTQELGKHWEGRHKCQPAALPQNTGLEAASGQQCGDLPWLVCAPERRPESLATDLIIQLPVETGELLVILLLLRSRDAGDHSTNPGSDVVDDGGVVTGLQGLLVLSADLLILRHRFSCKTQPKGVGIEENHTQPSRGCSQTSHSHEQD